MGALRPKAPAIPQPKKEVVRDPAQVEEDNEKAMEEARRKERRERSRTQAGRAATLLSKGAQGDDSTGLGTKRLLGG